MATIETLREVAAHPARAGNYSNEDLVRYIRICDANPLERLLAERLARYESRNRHEGFTLTPRQIAEHEANAKNFNTNRNPTQENVK